MFYRGRLEPFNPWKNCRVSIVSVYWQYVLVPVALLRQVPTMRGLRNRVVPTSTGHYQGNRFNQLRIFVHPPFPPLSVHSNAVVDLRYYFFVVGVAVGNSIIAQRVDKKPFVSGGPAVVVISRGGMTNWKDRNRNGCMLNLVRVLGQIWVSVEDAEVSQQQKLFGNVVGFLCLGGGFPAYSSRDRAGPTNHNYVR